MQWERLKRVEYVVLRELEQIRVLAFFEEGPRAFSLISPSYADRTVAAAGRTTRMPRLPLMDGGASLRRRTGYTVRLAVRKDSVAGPPTEPVGPLRTGTRLGQLNLRRDRLCRR